MGGTEVVPLVAAPGGSAFASFQGGNPVFACPKDDAPADIPPPEQPKVL